MKLTITDKNKKDLFVSIFQNIKNSSTLVNLLFDPEKLHVQGCDTSHVYLFNLDIFKSWFSTYEVDKPYNICLNASIFCKVLSTKNEHDIVLYFNDESNDILHIELINPVINKTDKGDFNKFFKIPLNEIVDYQELSIPDTDYDADFVIASKKLVDIVNQMSNFSEDVYDINIVADGDNIILSTESISGGAFTAKIDSDNIIEYAIVEDVTINLKYSIQYIKSCLTNKLSNNIKLSITDSLPMKIYYDLGDNSYFVYYIANKIDD
jgi:proliferating cell nuclear antigen PCNA